MVFGLGKKERRVPDLSRYDYYYQNKPDYNRSARLSAAAATAASGNYHHSQPASLRASQQYQRCYSLDSPRPRALSMYGYNSPSPQVQAQVQHAYLAAAAARRRPGPRATNAARPPHIRPIAPRGSNTSAAASAYRTYSLRSQSSLPLPAFSDYSPSSLNKQRRHNSTLGTSSDSPRRTGNIQRANSITTQVTEVKDPQGRTQSIVKKTIKRIDGYEYIETTTTTTTTDIVPLAELEENQRNFDEFSADFSPENNYIQEEEEEEEEEDNNNIQPKYEPEPEPEPEPFINTSHRPGEVEIVGSYGIVNENEYNSNDEIEKQGEVAAPVTITTVPPTIPHVMQGKALNDSFESCGGTSVGSNYVDTLDYIPPPASAKSQIPKRKSTLKPEASVMVDDKNNKNNNRRSRRIVPSSRGQSQLQQQKIVNDEPVSNKGNNNSKAATRNLGRRSSVPGNVVGHPTATKTKLSKRVSAVPVAPPSQQQQEQQHPLTEQEMYLKALEVAKHKVYNDRVVTNGQLGLKKPAKTQQRSSMSQRMTLRNGTVTPRQTKGRNGKSGGGSKRSSIGPAALFNRTSSISTTPTATAHSSGQVTSTPSTVGFASHYPTNTSRRANLGTRGGVPESYTNYSSNASSKVAMTDEEMYARALEIAAERYNGAHATGTTRSRQSVLASQSKSSSSSSVGGGSKSLRPGKNKELDTSGENKPNKVVSSEALVGAPTLAATSTNNGSTPASFGTPIATSDGAMSPSMNLTRYTSSGTVMSPLSAVTSNDNSTFGTEPNRIASNQSSLKLKKKFSLKNLLDKVVQFSQENSGYQDPKRRAKNKNKNNKNRHGDSGEYLVTEDQPPIATVDDEDGDDNDNTGANHPELVNYGPGATLPVQQPLNQKQTSDHEYGSFFARHPHQQRPDIGKINSNSNTNNTTGSSSIFSKNKPREVSSQQTADVTVPSDLLDGNGAGKPQMQQVQMDSYKYMTATQRNNTADGGVGTVHSKKTKGKFFTKLFKRSKQTA